MSLVRSFESDGRTYNIDDVMQGQSQFVWYDPLKQMALRPALRQSAILAYKETDVFGMFEEVQQILKPGKYTVKANPHYWTEYNEPGTLITTLTKASAPGAAGASVVLHIAKSSMSVNGKFSVPKKGYRGRIKETKQTVDVVDVNRTTVGDFTVTLKAINNGALDLTLLPYYTLLLDPLKLYKKGDRNCITGSGIVKNPPILRKGWIQKWEDMIPIAEDELDGYTYGKEFFLFKGLDSVNGKPIYMWSATPIMNEMLTRLKDNKIYNSLWGRRDDVTETGFNGLIHNTETEGMFNRYYDPTDGASLKSMLWNMIKSLRKLNASMDYLLLHDSDFQMDWSAAIRALIKETEIGKNYQLFGLGGEGQRAISWYDFKSFEAYDATFTPKKIGVFDNRRYGAMQESYCLLAPANRFKDTDGNDVPPVNYVNIAAAEAAWQDKTWIDDTRERGCRDLNTYVKTSYGMEQYGISKWGSWSKAKC